MKCYPTAGTFFELEKVLTPLSCWSKLQQQFSSLNNMERTCWECDSENLPPGLPEHLQPEEDHDCRACPVGVLSESKAS